MNNIAQLTEIIGEGKKIKRTAGQFTFKEHGKNNEPYTSTRTFDFITLTNNFIGGPQLFLSNTNSAIEYPISINGKTTYMIKDNKLTIKISSKSYKAAVRKYITIHYIVDVELDN